MRTTTTAALCAAALLTLTACSGSDTAKPDTAACKTAMAQQLDDAIDTGAKGTRPAACDGIDDATLKRLSGEAIGDRLEQDTALPDTNDDDQDATPAPIPPECRAWIERELRDSSDSIDADTGSEACAGLTDAEMDQAIDDVTDDLMAQDTP